MPSYTNRKIQHAFKSKFCIMTWNARSLKSLNKFNLFRSNISQAAPFLDVIVIVESWLDYNNEKFNIHNLPGFKMVHMSRKDRRGGGVIVYIKNHIRHKTMGKIDKNELQVLKVEIFMNDKWIPISAIYRPPHVAESELFHFLKGELDDNKSHIICGDTNIDILKENKFSSDFNSTLESFDAKICNFVVTRKASGTCIDQFIVKNFPNIDSCHTISTSCSDHDMIILEIDEITPKATSKTIHRSKVDYEKLIEIFCVDNNALALYNDPNDMLGIITKKVELAVWGSTVNSKFTVKTTINIAPWFSDSIIKSLKYKQNLIKKISKLKSKRLPYDQLQSKLNELNKQIDEAIEECNKSYFAKIFTKSDCRQTYRLINEILGTKNSRNEEIFLCENGETIIEERDIADTLNNYFATISNEQQNDDELIQLFDKYHTVKNVEQTFYLSEIDEFDVAMAIDKIDPNKAIGFDGISGSIVKKLKPFLLLPLKLLINQIISTAKYPENLKKANIKAIYKGTGEKSSKINYRPISVLPTFNKIVEIILKAKFENFLEDKQILDKNQLGFRKGSGTDLALAEFCQDVATSLGNGKIVAALFFDISKAFDTLNHKILLSKLHSYGFRGHVNELIKSYFTNRTQAVKINSTVSDYIFLKGGIGQGTNSGPWYFNIKMNDFQNLPLIGKFKRYADDIVCYHIIEKDEVKSLSTLLQHDIEIIQDYHEINGMKINPTKTKMMIFRGRNDSVPFEELITLRGDKISLVTQHRYLGGIFDEHLNYGEHINSIVNKILPIVRLLGKLKYVLPTDILLKIYYGHVQSHLFYMAHIYGMAKLKYIKKLQTLQNTALKHVFKLKFYHSSKDLYESFAKNVLPVKGIMCFTAVTLIHKIMIGKMSSNIKFDKITKGLRNDGDIAIQLSTNNYLKCSLQHYGSKLYNSIDKSIRSIANIDCFKKRVKKILRSKIDEILKSKHDKITTIFQCN